MSYLQGRKVCCFVNDDTALNKTFIKAFYLNNFWLPNSVGVGSLEDLMRHCVTLLNCLCQSGCTNHFSNAHFRLITDPIKVTTPAKLAGNTRAQSLKG